MFTEGQHEDLSREIHTDEHNRLVIANSTNALLVSTDKWVVFPSWIGPHYEWRSREEPLCEMCQKHDYETIVAHPRDDWENGRQYIRVCNHCDAEVANLVEWLATEYKYRKS